MIKPPISTVLLNKTLIKNINAINEKSANDLKIINNTYTESVLVQMVVDFMVEASLVEPVSREYIL